MNELEQKLVEALRSDRYEQTTGQLRRGDRFCCLGVGCDISGLGVWRGGALLTHVYDTSEGTSNASILPVRVMRALGWADDAGSMNIEARDGSYVSLATLNDTGFTFPQIADLIAAGFVEKENHA